MKLDSSYIVFNSTIYQKESTMINRKSSLSLTERLEKLERKVGVRESGGQSDLNRLVSKLKRIYKDNLDATEDFSTEDFLDVINGHLNDSESLMTIEAFEDCYGDLISDDPGYLYGIEFLDGTVYGSLYKYKDVDDVEEILNSGIVGQYVTLG